MKQLFLSILFVSTLSHVMAQVKTVVPIKHDISEIWEPEVKMVSPGKTQNEALQTPLFCSMGKT